MDPDAPVPGGVLVEDRRPRRGRLRRRRRRAAPSAEPEAMGRGRVVPTPPATGRAQPGVRPAAADPAAALQAASDREPEMTRGRAGGARAPDRRRTRLPRAGRRLQGHHAAARRPRRLHRGGRRAGRGRPRRVRRDRRRQGRRHGGARLHPRRARGARPRHRVRPGPQGRQAAARDARGLLRPGVRRGDPRAAPRRASRRGSGCCWSTTSWPPEAPSRRPASWSSLRRDSRRRRRADGAGLPRPAGRRIGDLPLHTLLTV